MGGAGALLWEGAWKWGVIVGGGLKEGVIVGGGLEEGVIVGGTGALLSQNKNLYDV